MPPRFANSVRIRPAGHIASITSITSTAGLAVSDQKQNGLGGRGERREHRVHVGWDKAVDLEDGQSFSAWNHRFAMGASRRRPGCHLP